MDNWNMTSLLQSLNKGVEQYLKCHSGLRILKDVIKSFDRVHEYNDIFIGCVDKITNAWKIEYNFYFKW